MEPVTAAVMPIYPAKVTIRRETFDCRTFSQSQSSAGVGGHIPAILHHLLVADDVRPARAGGHVREGDRQAEGGAGQVGEQQGVELSKEEEGGGQTSDLDGKIARGRTETQVTRVFHFIHPSVADQGTC